MLQLTTKGTTRHCIAVDPQALPAERQAAREFARYLKKITRATFAVVAPGEVGDRPCIAVGPSAALAVGALKRAPAGLGLEGTLRRVVGKHLVLTGSTGAPRGTLYAVYTFLEEDLGCRWWAPGAESIPKTPTLSIPALNKRFVPQLNYREVLYRHVFDAPWAARNRTNAHWGLTNRWGGHHVYEGWCHTFHSLVPPDPYFKTHPQWFALVDGKRVHEHAQLCLTNPELTAFVIDQAKRRLRQASPKATHLGVSQNDCAGYCQCPSCRKVDRHEGGPTGSLIHFVNTIAAGIEEEFPEVVVETLAYQYSRKPPRHAKPHPNVAARLCSYECDFLHPLDHVNNKPFADDVRGWARMCDRLYIWDYVTNFENFVQPHPNWYTLGPNMEFFLANNVKGVFEQGNHVSLGGEMAQLRAWVIAKLLWDHTLDAHALIAEFLAGYYGAASAHINHYMHAVHDAVAAIDFYPGSYLIQRCHARFGMAPPAKEGFFLDLGATWDAPFLSADVVLQSLRHFAAAAGAVEHDPVLSDRVDLARLPMAFVALVRWGEIRRHARQTRQGWPLASSRRQAFERFKRVAKRHGLTMLKEGGSRDLAWLEKVCAGNRTPKP